MRNAKLASNREISASKASSLSRGALLLFALILAKMSSCARFKANIQNSDEQSIEIQKITRRTLNLSFIKFARTIQASYSSTHIPPFMNYSTIQWDSWDRTRKVINKLPFLELACTLLTFNFIPLVIDHMPSDLCGITNNSVSTSVLHSSLIDGIMLDYINGQASTGCQISKTFVDGSHFDAIQGNKRGGTQPLDFKILNKTPKLASLFVTGIQGKKNWHLDTFECGLLGVHNDGVEIPTQNNSNRHIMLSCYRAA